VESLERVTLLNNIKTCIQFELDRLTLETVEKFSESLDITEYASRIIHPLVRTLDNSPELRQVAMSTLCVIAQQMNRRYVMFIPLVNRVIVKHRIQFSAYDQLISRLLTVGLVDISSFYKKQIVFQLCLLFCVWEAVLIILCL